MPWAYNEVVEIELVNGILKNTKDITEDFQIVKECFCQNTIERFKGKMFIWKRFAELLKNTRTVIN